jgi:hypothetical protein
MSVEERIRTMTDQQLLNLFGNATKQLVEGKELEKAENVLSAIESEWKARLDDVRIKPDRTGSPSVGMLATLGYRVGAKNGETKAARRRILKHVLERVLPLVDSLEYTMQWGLPNSVKRYSKLVQFLQSQLTNPANSEHGRAVLEWNEDLDWVQHTYGHLRPK